MQGLEGLEYEEGDGRRNILHNNKRIMVQMVWKKKRKRKKEKKKKEEENEMTHSFSFFPGSLFLFADLFFWWLDRSWRIGWWRKNTVLDKGTDRQEERMKGWEKRMMVLNGGRIKIGGKRVAGNVIRIHFTFHILLLLISSNSLFLSSRFRIAKKGGSEWEAKRMRRWTSSFEERRSCRTSERERVTMEREQE